MSLWFIVFPDLKIICFSSGTVVKESTCQCRRLRRHRFDPWVRKILWSKWQPTPVFLPGKFHGQKSLVGYSLCGCKELDLIKHTCRQLNYFTKELNSIAVSPSNVWGFPLSFICTKIDTIRVKFLLSDGVNLLFIAVKTCIFLFTDNVDLFFNVYDQFRTDFSFFNWIMAYWYPSTYYRFRMLTLYWLHLLQLFFPPSVLLVLFF